MNLSSNKVKDQKEMVGYMMSGLITPNKNVGAW